MVAARVRRVNTETIIVGIVVPVLLALAAVFGPRWLRQRGKVECEVLDWRPWRTNLHPQQRRLFLRFYNDKEIPVAVRRLGIEWSKGSKPLAEWAHPNMQFVDEHQRPSALGIVDLPPRREVRRTIVITPGRDDIVRELAEMDRAVFVAHIDRVGDVSEGLTPPW